MTKKKAGIDIGTHSIHVALCGDGKLLRAGCAPLPAGVRDPEVLAEAVKKLVREKDLSADTCALVLPASDCICRRMTLPMMSKKQLEVNYPFEFRDFITQDKDNYVFDYAVLRQTAEESHPQLEVMAAAALRATVDRDAKLLRRAGYRLKTAVPVEMAYLDLFRSLYGDKLSEEGTKCLLDVGHSSMRLYILHGGLTENTRVIEYDPGIDSIISQEMGVSVKTAREYKERNQDGAQGLPACRDMYHQVAVEVMKAINFHAYNSPGQRVDEIYFCGGNARVKPLLDTVAEVTSVRMTDAGQLLGQLGGGVADADRYLAAIGAALQ